MRQFLEKSHVKFFGKFQEELMISVPVKDFQEKLQEFLDERNLNARNLKKFLEVTGQDDVSEKKVQIILKVTPKEALRGISYRILKDLQYLLV